MGRCVTQGAVDAPADFGKRRCGVFAFGVSASFDHDVRWRVYGLGCDGLDGWGEGVELGGGDVQLALALPDIAVAGSYAVVVGPF